MLFTQKKSVTKPGRKLHSIHALLRERAFVGKIEASQTKYDFVYALQAATVTNNKLEFTGKFSVGKTSTAENVKAMLRGVQGAMGSATQPASFKITVPSALPLDPPGGQSLTEYTATRSSVGVIYLALSPLDGKALGLPFEMSAVQLNGRLAVSDQIARDLQWLLNQTAAALESNQASLAEPYVTEIDRVLRG
jgi:hypothetical protein